MWVRICVKGLSFSDESLKAKPSEEFSEEAWGIGGAFAEKFMSGIFTGRIPVCYAAGGRGCGQVVARTIQGSCGFLVWRKFRSLLTECCDGDSHWPRSVGKTSTAG